MKKDEIMYYLKANMPKVLVKIQKSENPKIKEFENDFLKIYNTDFSKFLKNDLNKLMVQFDQIALKIRKIEIDKKIN